MKYNLLKTLLTSATLMTLIATSEALELPAGIDTYLKTESLTEDLILPSLETTGKTFAEYVVTNRTAILADFSNIGTTPNKQKLLFAAMEFSENADYISTLQSICSLKSTGKISADVFEFAVRGTQIKRGFLSYNYQKTQIISLVQQCQALATVNTPFYDYLSAILNGSQKVIDKRYFEIEELPEPQPLTP